MAKNPTKAEQRARLSPHVAPAVAARDAAARSARSTRREAAKRAQAARNAGVDPALREAMRTKTIADIENLISGLQAELFARRAAAKAARDKQIVHLHAKAKRYRDKRRARLAAEACQR